jgi:hypothetical protein
MLDGNGAAGSILTHLQKQQERQAMIREARRRVTIIIKALAIKVIISLAGSTYAFPFLGFKTTLMSVNPCSNRHKYRMATC